VAGVSDVVPSGPVTVICGGVVSTVKVLHAGLGSVFPLLS